MARRGAPSGHSGWLVNPRDVPQDDFAAALDAEALHIVKAYRVTFLQGLAVDFDFAVGHEQKAVALRRELVDHGRVLNA